jgi:hypothetical protein
MEIHAPHHPILSLKEALVHLCIVTIGILIALSFEGVLEWAHHRELVREARQNLQNEILNNQKDIQIVLKSLESVKPRLVHAIDVVSDLSSPEKLKAAGSIFDQSGGPNTLLYGYTTASLNTASRATAEASGAFGFMDYGEIRKYAEIYEPQGIFSRAQDSTFKDAMVAATFGPSILAKAGPAEIEDVKRQLRLVLGGLIQAQIMATALNERYSKALQSAP